MLALLLRYREVGVVAEQRTVPTQVAGVEVRPSEHLAQPRRQVFDMPWPAHRAEHLSQHGICEATPILSGSQPMERVTASNMIEDRGVCHVGQAPARRHRKYESPQSMLVAAAKLHFSGPSPTERWAMIADARLIAKPA